MSQIIKINDRVDFFIHKQTRENLTGIVLRTPECPIEIAMNYSFEQIHRIWNGRIKRKAVDCVKP